MYNIDLKKGLKDPYYIFIEDLLNRVEGKKIYDTRLRAKVNNRLALIERSSGKVTKGLINSESYKIKQLDRLTKDLRYYVIYREECGFESDADLRKESIPVI